MCRDIRLTDAVWKFYKNYNLLVYAFAGIILSVIVIIDMGIKLQGGSGIDLSPLRVLGPTVWLPLKVAADKLMAAQTLVHSLMYIIACCYLVKARGEKNILLMGPWLVMHCFFISYQIVLVIKNSREYPILEVMLGLADFGLQMILLLTAYYTGMRWPPYAQRRGAADIPAGTEYQQLDREIEDDTVIRLPRRVVASSLAQPLENQGGAIDVSWPWWWRQTREAAAADPTSAGIEMQSLAAMSAAEPPTYEAAVVMAAEAALREREESGTEVVGIVEPEESGAEVVTVAGPRTSEGEIAAAGESQMSGGGEEPRASHTGWFVRRWLQTAWQLPAGGSEQASAPRPPSAGGSDTAT